MPVFMVFEYLNSAPFKPVPLGGRNPDPWSEIIAQTMHTGFLQVPVPKGIEKKHEQLGFNSPPLSEE